MPLIAALTRRGRTRIAQFDDGSELRCTAAFTARMKLQPGQEIDPIILERLRVNAAFDLATELARARLNRGLHSRRELARYLSQQEIPSAPITEALDQLEIEGDLDDHQSALALARLAVRSDDAAAAGEVDDEAWRRFRDRHGRRLQLRGFSPSAIHRALRLAWDEARDATAAVR